MRYVKALSTPWVFVEGSWNCVTSGREYGPNFEPYKTQKKMPQNAMAKEFLRLNGASKSKP